MNKQQQQLNQIIKRIRILKAYYQEMSEKRPVNKEYCLGNLHSLGYIEYMINEVEKK